MVNIMEALSGIFDVIAARMAQGCIKASKAGNASWLRLSGSKTLSKLTAVLLASRSRASTVCLLNLIVDRMSVCVR